MKNLMLSARCISCVSTQMPESFQANLSHETIERIKQLNAVVHEVDAYAIEVFEYCGSWSYKCLCSRDFGEGCSNSDEVIAMMLEEEAHIEQPMLRVTEDGFCFTSIPKHCGEDMALFTSMVPIAELESSDLYVDLD